mmetsp:Transcript_9558/g.14300  ORF Transcript_9558/g.14300 Transcript_9558/m.14300 type:complete len:94 (+) Transcript_9558:633-914(+)
MNRSPFTGEVQDVFLEHSAEIGSAVSSLSPTYKRSKLDNWLVAPPSKKSMGTRCIRRSKVVINVEDTQNIAIDAADALNPVEDDLSTASHVVS